jgi:proline dehydrogenase
MFASLSKAFFHALSRSGTLKKVASRYGMRRPTSFARRFIAGETVAEAIEAARTLEARGMTHTLDLLGESVSSLEGADGGDARLPRDHRRRHGGGASSATSR